MIDLIFRHNGSLRYGAEYIQQEMDETGHVILLNSLNLQEFFRLSLDLVGNWSVKPISQQEWKRLRSKHHPKEKSKSPILVDAV